MIPMHRLKPLGALAAEELQGWNMLQKERLQQLLDIPPPAPAWPTDQAAF